MEEAAQELATSSEALVSCRGREGWLGLGLGLGLGQGGDRVGSTPT